ncbi:MAG: thermonuclease family protein [Acidobacteriota bacterium]
MFRYLVLSLVALVATFAFVDSAAAQSSLSGQVVDVIDGRSVVVAMPNGNMTVQLQYIDVPEQGQALRDTVKEHLRGLVMGKRVDYRPRILAKDRTIAKVMVGGVDMSQQMLLDGAAWLIPSQSSGQEKSEFDAYAAMETAAKGEKRGVWSIPGLKPAWEFRAEQKVIEQRKEQGSFIPTSASQAAVAKSLSASNSSFGDVGSLVNRFDPASRTGMLSTTFLPVDTPPEKDTDKDAEKIVDTVKRASIDVTYYYKENDAKVRSGSFVVTFAFLSENLEFFANNDLVVFEHGKSTVIGKPKRTVTTRAEGIQETLAYGVSRNLLERIMNDESAYLKIGHHMVQLSGGRYLIYNMLQVTE